MWVVKLGGSLATTRHLGHWLQALAPHPVVIVPGGGPFADAVREAQSHWQFDDRAAHDMAILAMQQYGRMAASLGEGIATFNKLESATAPSRASIWLPCPDDLTASNLPASWGTTSDTLAAWLAGQLGASNLLIIKAAFRGERQKWGYPPKVTVDRLSRDGILDPVFPEVIRRKGINCWLCGCEAYKHLESMLTQPESHCIRILPSSG